jgi:hypothetical protein
MTSLICRFVEEEGGRSYTHSVRLFLENRIPSVDEEGIQVKGLYTLVFTEYRGFSNT